MQFQFSSNEYTQSRTQGNISTFSLIVNFIIIIIIIINYFADMGNSICGDIGFIGKKRFTFFFNLNLDAFNSNMH